MGFPIWKPGIFWWSFNIWCAARSFELFLILRRLRSATSSKNETPTQASCCEFCEIFKNCFFYETPPVASCEYIYISFRRDGLNTHSQERWNLHETKSMCTGKSKFWFVVIFRFTPKTKALKLTGLHI